MKPTHNKQIKKEALRAPIIKGVMFTEMNSRSRLYRGFIYFMGVFFLLSAVFELTLMSMLNDTPDFASNNGRLYVDFGLELFFGAFAIYIGSQLSKEPAKFAKLWEIACWLFIIYVFAATFTLLLSGYRSSIEYWAVIAFYFAIAVSASIFRRTRVA